MAAAHWILLAALLAATPAQGEAAMKGVVRMVDGDTFDLDVWRVRLFGIDAPEARQTCERDGERWRCGLEATRALNRLTAGQSVRCVEQGRDAFSLVLAVCYVGDADINARMVAEGWALALGGSAGTYAVEEKRAAAARAGIWSGRFITPEEWRRGARLGD